MLGNIVLWKHHVVLTLAAEEDKTGEWAEPVTVEEGSASRWLAEHLKSLWRQKSETDDIWCICQGGAGLTRESG